MRQLARMPRIDDCVKIGLDWLFPPRCVLCAVAVPSALELCQDCLLDLPRPGSQCHRCGGERQGVGLCGQCQRRPPWYDATIVPFVFGPPLDRLIRDFKYQRRLRYARVLGELLSRELRTRLGPLPEVIIPVPLHGARLRQRGFNQSVELARPLARALDIAIDRSSVIRSRNTRPQADLGLQQRSRNLRGAFSIRRRIRYRHVAIVDDVMTSGHTVNQLARCLRRAGAKNIQVWTLARK